MTNTTKKGHLLALVVLIVALVGLAIFQPRYDALPGLSMQAGQWWVLMVAAVLVACFYGWARYNLKSGLALGFKVLFDVAVSAAAVVVLSRLVPQTHLYPQFTLAVALFSFAGGLPFVREVNQITAAERNKLDPAVMAARAVKNICPIVLPVALVACLMMVAVVVVGGMPAVARLLPLAIGLVLSTLSLFMLMASVYVACPERLSAKKS